MSLYHIEDVMQKRGRSKNHDFLVLTQSVFIHTVLCSKLFKNYKKPQQRFFNFWRCALPCDEDSNEKKREKEKFFFSHTFALAQV